MASEPTLYARMELRLNDFEKKLARATAVTNKTMGNIERRGNQMTANLKGLGGNAFSGFAKGAVLALAPILTLSAALGGMNAALKQFGDINDQSIAAGISSDFFQSIANSAKLSGVEIDTVAGALASFAKASGLAAEGKGRMVSTLQALNPELLKNIQLATTQEQRIRLVADAIASSKDAASAAAIASATLGDAGVKLVAAFQGGGAQIDAMVIKGKELGLIINSELVSRADEFGDKLDISAQILDIKIKSALVDLAPLMSDASGWAAEFARLMAIAYEQLKGIEDRQFLRPLQNQLADTYNAMQPVKDRIAEIEEQLAGGGPNGMILKLDLTDAQAKLAALDDQAMKLLTRVTELQGAPKAGAPTPTIPSPTPTANNPNLSSGADLSILNLNLPSSGHVEDVATGFRNVRTAAQESAIAIGSAADAVDTLSNQFDTAQSMASSFTGTLIDGALSGKDAAETLSDAFGQLGNQLIQMAADAAIKSLFSSLAGVFGGGNLGNDIGAGIGGMFGAGGLKLASGGPVSGPGSGTSDSIPARLSNGEFVVNAKSARQNMALLEAINGGGRGYADGGLVGPGPIDMGRMLRPPGSVPPRMASGAATTTVPISIQIDATGADAAGLARVEQKVAELKASLPGTIKHVVSRRQKDIW